MFAAKVVRQFVVTHAGLLAGLAALLGLIPSRKPVPVRVPVRR